MSSAPAGVRQVTRTDNGKVVRGRFGRRIGEVATLVARGASPVEVCAAVARVVAHVMQVPLVVVGRYDVDGTRVTVLAACGDRPHPFRPGTCWPLDGPSMTADVLRTGRPARADDYVDRSGTLAETARASGIVQSAGAPIIVDGQVWGVLAMLSPGAPLPDHFDNRLAEFTDLLATAISNSQAREELHRLANEQAALRRVATLVAQSRRPTEVFEASIGEVGRLFLADLATLNRYEIDGTFTPVARWTSSGGSYPSGTRFPLEPGTVAMAIFASGRPGRVNNYEEVPGETSVAARQTGCRSAVGAPVIVNGQLWGFVGVASMSEPPMSSDTEGRLEQFSELLATAIANAESRAELNASRARIVATGDAARQRIERDLHDGAQQQLVTLAMEVRRVQDSLAPERGELAADLSRVADGLTDALDELREIAHGIHPAILAQGGLTAALKTLGRRSAVPVELDLPDGLRLPEAVQVTAYYVVAEGLTNAAKYADASLVQIDLETREGVLRATVQDDGVGGADPGRGSGLLGLKDRAEAIGGSLTLHSRHGAGTSLVVELPLDHERSKVDAAVPC